MLERRACRDLLAVSPVEAEVEARLAVVVTMVVGDILREGEVESTGTILQMTYPLALLLDDLANKTDL